MSTCKRCQKEVSFFKGFMTLAGVVCMPCKEILDLEKKLAELLAKDRAAALMDALTEHPDQVADAAKLAELDPARSELRIALGALAADGTVKTEAAFLAEPAVREAALALLWERTTKVVHLHALLDLGALKPVLALLKGHELSVNAEGLDLLSKLAAAGKRTEALTVAFRMRGLRSQRLCELIINLLTPNDNAALAEWLAGSRFSAIEDLTAFLAALREKSDVDFPALLPASRRAVGENDYLILLAQLKEEAPLRRELEGVTLVTSDLLGAMEQAARLGYAAPVFLTLKRMAAKSAPTPRLIELISSLSAAAGAPGEAAEILMQMGEWARARATLKVQNLLTPEAEAALRTRCREALGHKERELREPFTKAAAAAVEGRAREARSALTPLVNAHVPVTKLAALAFDALFTAAQLETVLALGRPCQNLAELRKGRKLKALPDDGETVKLGPKLREELNHKCKALVAADTSPHPALVWPVALSEEGYKAAVVDDERREPRFEAVAENPSPGTTESELIRPTLVRTFGAWLRETSVAGTGVRVVDRAFLYGLLARRLYSPVNPKADTLEMTGDKELAIDCGLRALAFMPEVPTQMGTRWGDFIRNVGGFLRHHGYQTPGIQKRTEFWPGWLPAAEKTEPEARVFAALDHLPALDPERVPTREKLYRPPEDAINPDAPKGEKKIW